MTAVGLPLEVVAPAAYRSVRSNVAALLAEPPRPGLAVPHCPDWRVEDLVGHMVAVCARVSARQPGTDAPPVTGDSLAGLLAQWEQLSPPVDAYLGEPFDITRGKLVMDTFTHELDLRDALGAPPPPDDHPALQLATTVVMMGLGASLRGHGMPALAFDTELGSWTAGDGAPAATGCGTWMSVYLSLTGRRTADQIERGLHWRGGAVGPYLRAFTWGPFTVPAG